MATLATKVMRGKAVPNQPFHWNDEPEVRTFADASALYNAAPTIGRSTDRAMVRTHPHKTDRRLRRLPDGSIVFNYKKVDYITYHPGGSVTIRGFGSQFQGPVYRTLPHGIAMLNPDPTGRVGDVVYMTLADIESRNSHRWGTGWVRGHTDNYDNQGEYIGHEKSDLPVTVARCAKPLKIRVVDGMWTPVRPEPFVWEELDRKVSLVVAREARLPDFIAWLDAYEKLGGEEINAATKPATADQLLAMLRAGDFMDVAEQLPRKHRWTYNRTAKRAGYTDTGLDRRYLERLRNKLYKGAPGALVTKSKNVLTRAELKRVEGLLRRFR